MFFFLSFQCFHRIVDLKLKIISLSFHTELRETEKELAPAEKKREHVKKRERKSEDRNNSECMWINFLFAVVVMLTQLVVFVLEGFGLTKSK